MTKETQKRKSASTQKHKNTKTRKHENTKVRKRTGARLHSQPNQQTKKLKQPEQNLINIKTKTDAKEADQKKQPKTILAKGRYLRSSAQKAGLVLRLIRRKKVEEAEKILRFSNKKAAALTLKVLRSALANAKHNLNWKTEKLIVKKAAADPGPTFKRVRFGGRGRIKPILKRTCHITIELEKIS